MTSLAAAALACAAILLAVAALIVWLGGRTPPEERP